MIAKLVQLSALIYLLLAIGTVSPQDDPICWHYSNRSLPFRVPDSLVPLFYDIRIRVELDLFEFHGDEFINVDVKEPIEDIVLNAKHLTVECAHFERKSTVLEAYQIVYCPSNETVVLRFNETIEPGEGLVHIKFNGELNCQMEGFYRSTYKTLDGVNKTIASTKFEPSSARMAFPCWDQPDLKSIFRINLTVPDECQAISNKKAISERPVESVNSTRKMKEVVFDDTPPMSTYLVAMIIGEFDYVEHKTNSTTFRVYSTVGRRSTGDFALRVARASLVNYKKYFQLNFQMNKLDLIGVPDFISGAMENFGAITFKEINLEVEPETAVGQLVKIISTIAHELAHQWFGNLDTVRWWSDIWLNEGFARYFQFKNLDDLWPQYQMWSMYKAEVMNMAFEADSLAGAQALADDPRTAVNGTKMKNIALVYNKGAAIVGMLNRWIGEENFKEGIHFYLEEHEFNSTDTDDLLTDMQLVCGYPVKAVMDTWTKQKGFPLIKVHKFNYDNDTVVQLSQSKFCYHPSSDDSDPDAVWSIPVEIIVLSEPDRGPIRTLMKEQDWSIRIPNTGPDAIIKLNPEMTGFYRVFYNTTILDEFVPYIGNWTMSQLDRINVLSDVLATAEAGLLSMDYAFKYITNFRDDDSFGVWSLIIDYLMKVNKIMTNDEHPDHYWEFTRTLLAEVHARLGWLSPLGELPMISLLRTRVAQAMAATRHPEAISVSWEMFKNETNGTAMLNELREVVYEVIGREADNETFNQLLEMYDKTHSVTIKWCIRKGLGASEDPERIKAVLDFAFSGHVRTQDINDIIIGLGNTKNGRTIGWEYFKERFNELRTKFKAVFERLLTSLIHWFASDEAAEDIRSFLTSQNYPLDSLNKYLERIKLNSELLKKI